MIYSRLPLLLEGAICNSVRLHVLPDLAQPCPATDQLIKGVLGLGPSSDARIPTLGWALDLEPGITHLLNRIIVRFVIMSHDITSHDTPAPRPPVFTDSVERNCVFLNV